MTVANPDALTDAKLYDALVDRGVPTAAARHLVADRNTVGGAHRIREELGPPTHAHLAREEAARGR